MTACTQQSSTKIPGSVSSASLRSKRNQGTPHRNAESFLAGKLYDDRGNRLGPSHAAKGGQRWRYYVSRALLKGRKPDASSITRVPAAHIEKQVFDAINAIMASSRRSVDCPNSHPATGKPYQQLFQLPGCARRDRASDDWRKGDRDPTQRCRRRRWPRSNIDHPLENAISLPAPRDRPRRRRVALFDPSDARSGACGLCRISAQRPSLAG